LDEGDNNPTQFLTYLVAALQTLALRSPRRGSEVEGIAANIGAGVLAALQSPQPPQAEAILTALLNEISVIPEHFLLVLDDYHSIDSQPVDQSLTFLVEHLPSQMHLVVATREDPNLPPTCVLPPPKPPTFIFG
jgi:LuxR family transcriptional regulator, maltose regulon positive regulatory protein